MKRIISMVYIVLFSILVGIVFTNFQPKINRIQIDIGEINVWSTLYIETKLSGKILEIKIYRTMANPLERTYNITITINGEKIYSQIRSIAPGQILKIGINIPIKTNKIKIMINNKLIKTLKP